MSAKKTTAKRSKSINRLEHLNILAGLFFVLAFAIITSLSAYITLAAKPPAPKTTPNLSLTPSNQSVALGSTLSVQIWTDSGAQSVNAAQVNLSYPVDKLNFVNINTANSSFGVEAKSSVVVSFTSGTALLSSATNQNILAATYSGSYSL
jgi:hypothetical protein